MNTNALESEKKAKFALFYLLLGTVAVGFGPVFVRLSELGPIATGFWRVTIAFPILILLWMRQKSNFANNLEAPNFKDYLCLALAGIIFGCDLSVWHLSIQYTSIANSTLLGSLSPVFIILWSWLVLHKPLKKKLIVAIFLAILGAAILINPNLHIDKTAALGNGLACMTSFFYACYLLLFNRMRKKFTAFSSTSISTFFSMLTLLVITYFSGESFFPHTAMTWLILIALAFFSHIIGQGLISYVLPYLPITFSSTALLVQPIVAAICGSLFFSEYLSFAQMFGIAIALLGIFLAKHSI